MRQTSTRKQLFNTFDPAKPLLAGDPRYVDCHDIRGSSSVLTTLADTIDFSESPTCQLLSGHRGCGKSTELYRLRQTLEQDLSYHVVYCEADAYVDLNSAVEYTDILLAVVQQLWRDAEDRDLSLQPDSLESFLEDLRDVLSSLVRPKERGQGQTALADGTDL